MNTFIDSMMTRRLAAPSLPGLIIVLLSAMVASGCSESEAKLPTEQRYYHQAQSDVLQQQQHYSAQRKFVGKVVSKQDASIGFEQNGKVAALMVDEGDTVKQGAVLAQQDTELLSIDRQELLAQLAQTEADLSLVRANLQRSRALKQKAFTSQRTLDELETSQQSLRAGKQRIAASLQANQLRINKSTLYAPFDAVISKRFITVGEVIGAGTAALKILQTGAAEVKVGVPVQLLQQLKVQQTLSVSIGQQTFNARLLTKGQDVSQTTRTVQLRLALDQKAQAQEATAINGQLAYLHLPQQYQQTGYWVPMSALTDGVRGLWNVYTLMPAANSDLFTLQSRNVQILYATEKAAYISGAVSNGERYLTAGLQRLVPGQQVKTSMDKTAPLPTFSSANTSTNSQKGTE